MAAGVTIKSKRKAGAFVNGELAAGEWGLDVSGNQWYYSLNGTTVNALPASTGVGTANSPNANEFARFTNATTIEGRTVSEAKTDLGLDNVTNESKATMFTSPALTGTPTAPTAGGGANTTQIATTAFVTAAVAAAVTGLLEFQGNTDCSANPNYPAASKGDLYYVSVAGKIGGAAGKSVDIGDAYIAKADNAGGTEASVGASWFVLEHNLAGALLGANNLSDVANPATARSNIGANDAANLTTGNVPTAQMQTNVAAAINAAAAATLNNANIILDGGSI
jgi:hypothetical protein